jgi:hypothetical protein
MRIGYAVVALTTEFGLTDMRHSPDRQRRPMRAENALQSTHRPPRLESQGVDRSQSRAQTERNEETCQEPPRPAFTAIAFAETPPGRSFAQG